MQIIRPELSLYKSQRNLVNAQAGMQHVNLMPKIGLLGAGVFLRQASISEQQAFSYWSCRIKRIMEYKWVI